MARLKISGPGGTRHHILSAKTSVGRAEGADLVLEDQGISRKHCEFEPADGTWLVRDLGSSNGTTLNGEKVAEHALSEGDRVRVGATTLTFSLRDADHALRFESGEHAGREVALTSSRTTLGRKPDNSIPFVDVKVSGLHLEIVQEGDGFVLRDLGSTNGTFLDGRKIEEVALSHGDRVKLGQNEFTFLDLTKGEPESAAAPRAAAMAPPRRSQAAALLGLVGVVLAVGGGAAWYFLGGGSGEESAAVKSAPPVPAGSLLVEDWSFEDSGAVAGAWTAELGDGFAARRGRAASGSMSFAASVSGGHAVASRRSGVALPSARTLRFSGRLAADDGALVSAGIRFVGETDPESDGSDARRLTRVAARSTSPSLAPFEAVLLVPAWARTVEVVLVARGEGAVAADDLALAPGGAAAAGTKVGDLELRPAGGDAFVLDHGATLLDLFLPFGAGTVAPLDDGEQPARVELPPGAFASAVTAAGATLTLRSSGAPFAPDGFAAIVPPEIAAAGITLLTAQGSERRFGAFGETEARALLLGAAADRFELAFSAPASVSALARGDTLELRLRASGDLVVTLRSGFEAERKEAGELLARAQEDWRAGRAGAALAKLKEIRDRLPHDERAWAVARDLDAEIVPKLEAELAGIEAEAAAAEFLGSLERSKRTLARAEALLEQAQGLEAARELSGRIAAMRDSVAAMERDRREQEAARLLRLARAYQAQAPPAPDRSATARELLAELQETYADTAAAREARGE